MNTWQASGLSGYTHSKKRFDVSACTLNFPGGLQSPSPWLFSDTVGRQKEAGYSELPGIWITLPFYTEDGKPDGRDYVNYYGADTEDDDGRKAFRYAAGFYSEAMEYTDVEYKRLRIECFQSAEILYLSSVSHGNTDALTSLGYIYSYDRCEGWYFDATMDDDVYAWKTFPADQRAYECFKRAAQLGDAQACYKTGDHLSAGRGCALDEKAAYEWYQKAWDLGRRDDPVVWGSIALRLAESAENGMGCPLSFEDALSWYRIAQSGLGGAVGSGAWYYEKQLARAKNGTVRMQQEIHGGY